MSPKGQTPAPPVASPQGEDLAASPSGEHDEETISTEIFKAEVRAWAKRLGVEPAEIHIRPMRRKWASCSSKGRLTFNSELLQKPAPFRAKVIVHELLHLKVPNHGKLFRALLRAYLAKEGLEP
ncbi:MAG: M48 metallopeptidase family protein [Thermaceae bacterium]